jgi:hypothetical protein
VLLNVALLRVRPLGAVPIQRLIRTWKYGPALEIDAKCVLAAVVEKPLVGVQMRYPQLLPSTPVAQQRP